MAERAPLTLAVAFPSAAPAPLTGAVEMRIAEAVSSGLSRPEKVTQILAAAFIRIGGEAAGPALIRRLATGARAFLLLRAAEMFSAGARWFSARCAACGEDYDLRLNPAAAPRSAPGAGFPLVTVETELGPRRFEAPNGLTEAALTGGSDPLRILAARTGLSERAGEEAMEFSAEGLETIAAALDAVTPDIADIIATTCPACGAGAEAQLDPLTFAFPTAEQLDREIHHIARAYGWREPEILALAPQRRARYAALIFAEAGRGRA